MSTPTTAAPAPDAGRRAALEKYAGHYPPIVSEVAGGYCLRSPHFAELSLHVTSLGEGLAEFRTIVAEELDRLVSDGIVPPSPEIPCSRSTQVNVRVSKDELSQFETAAERLNYRGVGSFLRDAALAEAFAVETGIEITLSGRGQPK